MGAKQVGESFWQRKFKLPDIAIGFIMVHTIHNSLESVSVSVIPWLEIGSNSGHWPCL